MKNKKGKKLVVLGAMAALLTLIGVSGSQTYAKYVENASVDSETATVAKWGYIISAESNDLFGLKHDTLSTSRTSVSDSGVSVVGTKNIVAPGTFGEMTFSILGDAEVLARIQFNMTCADDVDLIYTEAGVDHHYYPLVWTLSKSADGVAYTPVVEAGNRLTKIANYVNNLSCDVSANADAPCLGYYKLSYEWAFENTDAVKLISYPGVGDPVETPFPSLTYDKLDTYFGHLVNGDTETNYPALENFSIGSDTVDFAFNLSVTQIQEPTPAP